MRLGIPELLAAWRQTARMAIPEWQIPSLRAPCNKKLTAQVATEAPKPMLGGDRAARNKNKNADRAQASYRGKSNGEDGCRVDDARGAEDEAYYGD